VKVTYTTPTNRLTLELDVTTGKQAFEAVAAMQELFEEPCCGKCKSQAIRFECREHDGNKYYKMRCQACYATLDFGQNKDNRGLFAKRKDKDGNWMPDNGWYIYQRQGDAYEAPEPVARPTSNGPRPQQQPVARPNPAPAQDDSNIPF
jgi:hypothetical protein